MKIKSFALIAGIVLATLFKSAGQPVTSVTFIKILTGPIVTNSASSVGTTWVDIDGDGDLDLFVSNAGGSNLLYRNDGNGLFTQITDSPLVNAGPGSYSTSWADVNNDGRIDCFIGRIPGPCLLFLQQADGTFVQSTLGTSAAFGAAWADYDIDGWLDLLVAYDSLNIRWHNNGQGTLISAPSTPIDPSGDAIAWADYDGDGDMDLLVVEGGFSGGGNSRLYRNDGNGVFTRITTGPLALQSAFGTAAAWGDYDNDGYPDPFLARGDSGQSLPSFLFHNNGNGTFTQVLQSPFTNDVGYALSCSWADYDNDGWLDLFVTESNGTVNRLYHNNSDGTFSRVLSGPIASDEGNCAGNSWGDYDRNGFLDLFVGHGTPDYLYHNDGNSNAWITIKCVGTRSNRSAIGAKVRVKATIGGKTFWQLREINTGDGWGGVPLEAHFGLGDATNIETLRIEWPSGTVQELQNVTAKQYFTIAEPAQPPTICAVYAPIGVFNNEFQFEICGSFGQVAVVESSTNLLQWIPLQTNTFTSSPLLFRDPTWRENTSRFYRLKPIAP